MYAAFISSYAGSNLDWTSITNAELTAENRPAFVLQLVNTARNWGGGTHEDQSRVQVFVVLLHIVVIVLARFPLVGSVEISSCIFCLDGVKEIAQRILNTESLSQHATHPVSQH